MHNSILFQSCQHVCVKLLIILLEITTGRLFYIELYIYYQITKMQNFKAQNSMVMHTVKPRPEAHNGHDPFWRIIHFFLLCLLLKQLRSKFTIHVFTKDSYDLGIIKDKLQYLQYNIPG